MRRKSHPLFRSMRRLRGAFWRRRVATWLIRALWLSLLVPTIFMVGYLWTGWRVRWQDWLYPMLLVGLLSILWSARPISLKRMIHRLDNHLELQARLITAFEISHPSLAPHLVEADNMVVQRLLQEAVQIIIDLRRYVRLISRSLWVELHTLAGVGALLSALLILDALTPQFPEATPVDLPLAWQEPAANEVIPPDSQSFPLTVQQEVQVQALSDDQLRAALQALADALRDQAVTHSIAEAIDRDDLSEAAENIRRLADQLGDLSQETQAELGDSLQEAADKIGDGVPILTQPLEAGSNAFDSGDLNGAGQALEDLAEALDSIAESPSLIAQTEQAEAGENEEAEAEPDERDDSSDEGSGEEAGEGDGPDQPTDDERLAIEGEPLELESDLDIEDRVVQPAELDAEAGDEYTEDAPFARQPLGVADRDLGPDPLTYPWEKRNIIRSYFKP